MPVNTYTTHDIARFCDVYPSSVYKWISDGKLRSQETAGGHHRVTREDLVAFLKKLRVPIPSELVTLTRVMIVDDDLEVTRVLERAFGRHRALIRTEVCHDGISALIRIGQQPPDLVILDVVLPKMDGVQVCRVLKTKPETRAVKVIAISGRSTSSIEKKLVAAKVDAFFRKPLDQDELLAKAGELLELELRTSARR